MYVGSFPLIPGDQSIVEGYDLGIRLSFTRLMGLFPFRRLVQGREAEEGFLLVSLVLRVVGEVVFRSPEVRERSSPYDA